jgi:hypothetical protein
MLKYSSGPLSIATQEWLEGRQKVVDKEQDRRSRYQKARKMFSAKTGRAFAEIRGRLSAMSPPGRACFYCELDRHRDIDHVKPIRHFPESCFDWSNYLYACSICNQDAKRDRYAIIVDDGTIHALDRTWSFDAPLPSGVHAVIDIRSEDPFEFLTLDKDTGRFVACGTSGINHQRALFTRDLFRLDDDVVVRARRAAWEAFVDYMTRLASARQADDAKRAERILGEIRELPHPTVLAEMRRQANRHSGLATLLRQLPSDLGRRECPTV